MDFRGIPHSRHPNFLWKVDNQNTPQGSHKRLKVVGAGNRIPSTCDATSKFSCSFFSITLGAKHPFWKNCWCSCTDTSATPATPFCYSFWRLWVVIFMLSFFHIFVVYMIYIDNTTYTQYVLLRNRYKFRLLDIP